MILRYIKLSNIRSYESQHIEFPLGSTLLAGDIGSGKSTILLAIEFALFGIKRPYLSGSSLLRHGKKEGSVELNFEIKENEIIIHRSLKRNKEDISQGSGFIVINGVKKEGSHIELKAEILTILGYPKELVSKSKDLLYRYTVYTPQEEMKSIIFDEKDLRLDILRRVFNIDKYKRISNNILVVTRSIRETIKEKSGYISDYEEKKRHLNSLEASIEKSKAKITELIPKLESAQKSLMEATEIIMMFEKEIKELNITKSELIKIEAQLKNLIELKEKEKKRIEKLELEYETLKKSLESFKVEYDIHEVKKIIWDKEMILNEKEKLMKDYIGNFHTLNTNINSAIKLKEKILLLNKCPSCEQSVPESHKHFISDRQDKDIRRSSDQLGLIKKMIEESESEITKLRDEIKSCKEKESNLRLNEVKLENLRSKEHDLEILKINQSQYKAQIGRINEAKLILSNKIGQMVTLESDYDKARQQFDEIQRNERFLDLEKARLETEIRNISENMRKIQHELFEKEKAKISIKRLNELKSWIEEFFIHLMGVMEKHVMLQIQMQFNDLFQNWASMLLEDDAISLRIDYDFTPIVEQNGYESSIDTLSGGEKTSIALSYRLSLNKVINDIMTSINTQDLIILDEPTDGFSSEQLDKVNEVLAQLKMKQTIIVSHESKIESFVENVIRIAKRDNRSVVTT